MLKSVSTLVFQWTARQKKTKPTSWITQSHYIKMHMRYEIRWFENQLKCHTLHRDWIQFAVLDSKYKEWIKLKSNAIQWELRNDEEFVFSFEMWSVSWSCTNYGIGVACFIWWHFLNPDSGIKITSNARGLKILELLISLELNYFQRFGWLKSLIVGVFQDIGAKSFINWQCIPTI